MESEVREVDLGYWQGEVEFRHRAGSLKWFESDGECRGFWRLALGNGCPLGCRMCFLLGVFAWLDKPVLYDDQSAVHKRIVRWMERPGHWVLNTGELSDSLALDQVLGFTRWAVPLFEVGRHDLLLLSKATEIEGLLEAARAIGRPIKRTIVSWSLNATWASRQYEGISPSPVDRIMAARECQEAGYRVRLRIDPMIPFPGWREGYGDLVRMIVNWVHPERVTLGSLRFLPRTRNIVRAQTPSLTEYTDSFGDGRWRIPLATRISMYEHVAGLLQEHGIPVALCKETEELRRGVGLAGPCHCEP